MQTEASSTPAAQPTAAAEVAPAAKPAPADFLEGRSFFTKDVAEEPKAEAAPAESSTEKAETQGAPEGEAKPAEAAPQLPPAEKKEPQSKHLALLAKKERELRAKEAQLEARAKAADEYEAARKSAAQNPLEAMSKLGLTFEQVQDFVLNGKKPTAEQKTQLEQATLKAEIEEIKKAREKEKAETERAHREHVIANFKTVEIPKVLEAAGSKYELTRKRGKEGVELIFNAINTHWNQTLTETGVGEVLSIEQAADGVEEYFDQLSQDLLTTSKVKSKLAPVVEAPKPAVKAASESSGPTRAARTLTNSHAAPNPPQQRLHKTAADYRAEAAAVLRFTDD